MNFIHYPILLIGFFIIVIIGIIIDIFFLKKYLVKYDGFKHSCIICIFWIFLSFLFSIFLWIYFRYFFGLFIANNKIILFLICYFIEQSLSIDNVLTWFLLFQYFSIPLQFQKKVLFYGLIGAIFLRSIVIFFGSWLLLNWSWILFLFGLILLFTAIELLVLKHDDINNFKDNLVLKYIQKIFPITYTSYQENFFICNKNNWHITPLFIALLMIECSDIIFSIDSIPAIFSITTDSIIVWTSNIFAVLSLRAFYFLISNIINRFSYIKPILSLILILISIKMLFENFVYVFHGVFPMFFSVLVIIFLVYNFILKYLS
ncbi:TerC/Alx family metal homeostasis membrane protein [Buchnera aphidicola]|uniref:TerC/Alx family metal homeostasis membrane protein n=1 Tax=Buchnera aphidicola TaxID=9 RepID=UPI0034644969